MKKGRSLRVQLVRMQVRGLKPAHEYMLTVRDSRGVVVLFKTVVVRNPQFRKKKG